MRVNTDRVNHDLFLRWKDVILIKLFTRAYTEKTSVRLYNINSRGRTGNDVIGGVQRKDRRRLIEVNPVMLLFGTPLW